MELRDTCLETKYVKVKDKCGGIWDLSVTKS